ncbi:hypothetical protein COU60_03380 [Candidatus Pacearchaeota archaeon CG10_big_fil_rev_8_21_14_0_10_34_76]|nr:MAG: hypothetical protein COU60_03380 [Candidatus Pacearchaeota archaeon CG10_big_fil_rev_8_21_14_0_10_34_76]
MAKKKEENVVERAVDAVEEVIEDTAEVVKEITEKVKKTMTGKKTNKKKTEKTEEKEIEKKVPVKSKLEELKEKAKALEKKVGVEKKIDIKSEVKGESEDKKDLLVPIEDYLKASIHLGTRVITPDMRKYVYKRRADGLAVFNTNLIDDMLRDGAEYLSKFAPEDIVVVCKREAGWRATRLFGETLGVKTFTKKYPAGSLTNPNLENFFETDLILICDPWLDKNALNDANKIKINVMSVCDTNNFTKGIDKFVIGNNKSGKSIGIILYLLAKLYVEKRNLNIEVPGIEKFIENWAEAQIPA